MSRIDPVCRVIGSVLRIAPDLLDDGASPETLPAWDSLSHLGIVMALESEFGVELSTEDAIQLRSVRTIRMYLESRGVACQ
jgi:acyl carrier protein